MEPDRVAETFDGEAPRIAYLPPAYYAARDTPSYRKATDASRRARKRLKQLTHQTTTPPSNLNPAGLYRAAQIGTRAQWNENADRQPTGSIICVIRGAAHGCLLSWLDHEQYRAYMVHIRAAKQAQDTDEDETLPPLATRVVFKYKLPAGRYRQAGEILPQLAGVACDLFFPAHAYVLRATSVSIETDERYRTTGRITLDIDSAGGAEVDDPAPYLRASLAVSKKTTASQRRLGIGI